MLAWDAQWSWQSLFTFKNPGVLLLIDIWKLTLKLVQSKLFCLRRGMNSFRPTVSSLQFSAQESVNRIGGLRETLTQPTYHVTKRPRNAKWPTICHIGNLWHINNNKLTQRETDDKAQPRIAIPMYHRYQCSVARFLGNNPSGIPGRFFHIHPPISTQLWCRCLCSLSPPSVCYVLYSFSDCLPHKDPVRVTWHCVISRTSPAPLLIRQCVVLGPSAGKGV